MDFLKTLLIILFVFFALRILLRFAMPYITKWLMKKASERMGKAFGAFGDQMQKNQSGGAQQSETQLEKTPKSKKVVGEYIDFEEVD